MSTRPLSYVDGDETQLSTQRSGYQIPPGTDQLRRSASTSSATKVNANYAPSRSNTLTKKASLKKRASLRRSKSGRSLKAGSMRADGAEDDFNSVFFTPIPTKGSPTDALAERFNAWRKLLKDIITYFREIQSQYEARSKSLLKLSNVINNTQIPSSFLSSGGIDEANNILRNYYKHSITESNKARDIEADVITQLNGLRSDLNQKIKEIKGLSGDFKNSVDKEQDGTRRAVEAYEEALHSAAHDPSSATGKHDPFILRLQVEKQIERQIEEENYLHRAYLNLEGSGRELESIVVGEIQKAYNAYAGILKRESDYASSALESLRAGPIAMPKDHEWVAWVEKDPHFVSPDIPLRRFENLHYPGKYEPAAAEIRAGNLERKSKYLKSYTPGWYVLSPTHLHEFKSPDNVHLQQPVMSLCLSEQKLGSHSQQGSSSDKFSLKGKQTGGFHKGHSWVFRAESHDMMMAWYEDIRILTEKTGAERSAFLRKHARSVSGGTNPTAPSVSSDGMDEDEADATPFSADQALAAQKQSTLGERPVRPEAGGRFPSDIDVSRHMNLQAPLSPSSPSGSSDNRDEAGVAASSAGAAPILVGAAATAPSAASRPVAEEEAKDEADVHPALRSGPSPTSSAPLVSALGVQSQPVSPVSPQTSHELSAVPRTPNGQPTDSKDGVKPEPSEVNATPAMFLGGLGATVPPITPADEKKDQIAEPFPDLANLTVTEDPRIAPVGVVLDAAESEQPSLPAASPVPSSITEPSASSPTGSPTTTTANGDGHFHKTGHIFPSVLRHDTDMSVSQLHVPGEFPGQQSARN